MGLFSREPLSTGEVVIRWGGTVFTKEDIVSGKANLETIAVLDENLYLADPVNTSLTDEYALNHSCDSNLWLQDAITLVTRFPIAAGEELTADYALWLYEQNYTLDPCHCGSPRCRGKLTDTDWQIPELQARYAGHFSPFLNRLIKNLRSA